MAQTHECVHYVRGVVGFGVSTVAALHYRAHTYGREQVDKALRREVEERGLYEVCLAADVGAELIPVLEVGKVAAALSRDHNFAGWAGHFLQDSYLSAVAGFDESFSRAVAGHQP